MTVLESNIMQWLTQLVPKANSFEVRANIGDKGYSVEFFATIDGIRYQCYDMIDRGIIKEKDFDAVVTKIVQYFRTTPEYSPGQINKFSFEIAK